MVNVRVSIDLSGIDHKLSNENSNYAKHAMANQMLMDMERFVPKKEGDLRASGHVTRNSDVEYSASYARRQYFAPKGWKYTTPGTGPKWLDSAKNAYSDNWKQAFVKGLGVK
ncbi:MAG: minor capsid protein [Streptococcaceae bacterium]|nr:minor capsid protein [Streptococcaceae bacterium]MCL2680896.1 minor capsid protein [Streptococcaceae bacterium]MCL2858092.1 minor capsid protein [Streptococcaceae bacterium]